MGLIADKIIPQLVIEEMLKIFGEDKIVHPEHQPRLFEYQVRLAKWVVDMNNNSVIVKQEISDLNQKPE